MDSENINVLSALQPGEEVVMRPVKGCNMNRYVYLKTPEKTYLTKEQKECIKGIKEFFAGLSL